jgi:DNA-binding CsgD family transcriptional regulator
VRSATARALRARGVARGPGAAGREDLCEAVETADASDSELQRCLTRLSYGMALRADGKRAEAGDVLRRALDSAEAAGARAVADKAREELHGLGARPRRARMTGADALTPGERRVAQMASRGMTNRQIAEELFVTPKAVQWHLMNAYRKLGVNSRDALAPALNGSASQPS